MLAQRLKELRQALQKRQMDLANDLGINPSAISQMESGKINPSMDNLVQLWQLYQVDLHWLITGEGTMFSDSKLERSQNTSKSWETLQKMLNKSLEEIASAKMELVDSTVIDIPVVGEIAAGPPVESNLPQADTISIRKGQIRGLPGNFISLRVNGHSMEPSLYHDDIVVIYQCNDWEKLSGKICAVRIDGAITLKMMTLDHKSQTVVLLPINEEYQPILVKPEEHSDLMLIGNVASLYRRFCA
ncbi:MAG: XRE family transcriptional regulator [Candidatus Cloacimonetes bacterium]|jgi:SOS-response transcriptional repressor LexA|nr:XRE family transcriptional regulator [Candidatus Cloacimonadota bacterium]MCK9335161.1 XRE family transcriptional regulator [Candidatus Cloacimonadota bacterium]MDD3097156.1 XRE family transcriptional regulator [Candidatus Cloacimonadota bacterium]MDD3578700.1 XRE family transcriptional regulator [Candidatus Cloacimonadota bacterium]MDY0337320.1 XRE family transcriptional regulator [Candidatus Cloacimonadaceae bacterium]